MWKILINSTGVPFVSGKKYKQLGSSFNNHCFIIRRKQWHPTSVLLPGKSQGWRILVDCSPWGLEESDTTEWLHFHFSLSCIGEGNGNPLQCSCQENLRDGGAWWAAVYGAAQSRTRLKWLSSSSSSSFIMKATYILWEKVKIKTYSKKNENYLYMQHQINRPINSYIFIYM